MIRNNESANYSLEITNIKSIEGASIDEVNSWSLHKNLNLTVKPNKESWVTIISFKSPKNIPDTKLELTIKVIKDNNISTEEVHNSTIEIQSRGFSDYLWDNLC